MGFRFYCADIVRPMSQIRARITGGWDLVFQDMPMSSQLLGKLLL